MTPSLALLPPPEGILFDEIEHRYSLWSQNRQAWLQPASTSQVLSASGAKGFDNTFWRRSLMDKHGMTFPEAELYMELHKVNRAAIGTELHGLIRAELLGGKFTPKQAESLMLLSVWRREFLPRIEEVKLCEIPLASRAYFYTGTPDLFARVDGLWLTVDWKSKVSEEKAKKDKAWVLQLAGYDGLVAEQYGIQSDGAMNLMIWPDGCEDVFYNRADITLARQRFVGHLAWSHFVRGVSGCWQHQGALLHLLRIHPDAFAVAEPPEGLTEQMAMATLAPALQGGA
jgi:hypothetical protein